MNKPIAPCIKCTPETGRCAEPNCHITCERYNHFLQLNNEYKDEVLKEKELDSLNYSLSRRRKKMGGINIRKANEHRRNK